MTSWFLKIFNQRLFHIDSIFILWKGQLSLKNRTQFCRRHVYICVLEGGYIVIAFIQNCCSQHFQSHISSEFVEILEATVWKASRLSISPSSQITQVLYQKNPKPFYIWLLRFALKFCRSKLNNAMNINRKWLCILIISLFSRCKGLVFSL